MKKIKGYIWFTFSGDGLSVAKKLENEGNTVIVAQIQDIAELHTPGKTEEPDKKEKRLAIYDGLIQKHDAKEVLKHMAKMPNKDDWFIIFDLNSLWYYSQKVVAMGFTNGFFPTEEDTLFEDDRDKGKQLVKEFWPDLEVAEVHEFKSVDDGKAFLEEHPEDLFVLKANAEGDLTVVPQSEDPDLARQALTGALETNKSDYESKGYILELKIANPIEITPQMVFYNGVPIFSDIDIENKPVGSGSIGDMTGCAGNLIIQTDMDDEINTIAFPDKVYEMAAQHDGMFVWDASILIDGRSNKLYFGEFCPNRWGYDAFFTEVAMAGSASNYFESLVAGHNPLKKQFGVAVRMMNLKKYEESTLSIKGDGKDLFLYDVKLKDDGLVSVGNDWAFVVATGASDNITDAVNKTYAALENVSFNGGYYRPKFDFVSKEYQNSIPNRYEFGNGWLFNAEPWETPDVQIAQQQKDKIHGLKTLHQRALNRMEREHAAELTRLKGEIQQILI